MIQTTGSTTREVQRRAGVSRGALLHHFPSKAELLVAAPIVCEGAWGPRPGKPGRAYLAVREDLQPADVMTRLQASALPFTVTLIHPEPIDP